MVETTSYRKYNNCSIEIMTYLRFESEITIYNIGILS